MDIDISYDERSVRVFDVNSRVSIRVTASDTGGVDVPSLYNVRILGSPGPTRDPIRACEVFVPDYCDW